MVPKVTTIAVVIPFYNGSQFIETAIKSVLAQSLKAREIIIVDDGSCAGEARALAEIADRYPVVVLTKENGGQGSARNLGVEKAKSDFICLLDQDDYFLEWHNEHLASLVESRADERFAFAYGDLWRSDGGGHVILHTALPEVREQRRSRGGQTAPTHVPGSRHPKSSLREQLRYDCFILPSATMISRKAFLDIGGFDERLSGYEDDDLFTRLYAAGYTSLYDSRPVTNWTVNEASTTFSVRFSRSRYTYFEKLVETYPNRPNVDWFTLRDILVPRFMFHFVQDYLRSCFLNDGYLVESRQRLLGFLEYLEADPACNSLRPQKHLIRILARMQPPVAVALATIVSSKAGSLLMGRRGIANRQRLRDLVWLRKHG